MSSSLSDEEMVKGSNKEDLLAPSSLFLVLAIDIDLRLTDLVAVLAGLLATVVDIFAGLLRIMVPLIGSRVNRPFAYSGLTSMTNRYTKVLSF